MTGYWWKIVNKQINVILQSGLYDKSSEILICCLGPAIQKAKLKRMIAKYPKFKIVMHNVNIQLYEYPTLTIMQNLSYFKNFAAWYIHTKGVTSGMIEWRKCMEYFVIKRHEYCYKFIESGYDVVGPFLTRWAGATFFSGNFWWTRSSHLRRLIRVDQLVAKYPNNRYAAEFFFILNKWGRIKNLFIGNHFSRKLRYNIPKLL